MPPLPLSARPRADRDRDLYAQLQARAHQPEVQARIRQAIRSGAIRVTPGPGGTICIQPAAGNDPAAI